MAELAVARSVPELRKSDIQRIVVYVDRDVRFQSSGIGWVQAANLDRAIERYVKQTR